MQAHASCASRDGTGVLLLGPSGCGKSDMLLRLIDRGFELVADDRVDIDDGWASAPLPLAGLLEVRGLGILRLPFCPRVQLGLAVELGSRGERLPAPARHIPLGLALVWIDPASWSGAQRISLALDCAVGRVSQLAGAFT